LPQSKIESGGLALTFEPEQLAPVLASSARAEIVGARPT
jgi:hypothetical protein